MCDLALKKSVHLTALFGVLIEYLLVLQVHKLELCFRFYFLGSEARLLFQCLSYSYGNGPLAPTCTSKIDAPGNWYI